jgi:hypothetical protein
MSNQAANTELSHEDIKSGFIMAFKLINTFASKSFEKSLSKSWKGSKACENILAIEKNSKRGVVRKLKDAKKYDSFKGIYAYLEHLAKQKNVSLKKSDRTGQVHSVDVIAFSTFETFRYLVSCTYYASNGFGNGQFQFHELASELIYYMTSKDTIENGSGNTSLDKVIHTLIETKPSGFFYSGFVFDLFVHDRMFLAKNPGGISFLRCNKDWLTTRQIKEKDYKEKDPKYFDVFKVA